jgi:hypothetical protein
VFSYDPRRPIWDIAHTFRWRRVGAFD